MPPDFKRRVSLYEASLANKGLPDIPFHATPLMRAHDAYGNMGIEQRKYLLMSFNMLAQEPPVRHKSFVYESREFGDAAKLQSLIRRDLAALLVDNLEHFQGFDHVKVYCDKGQPAVDGALEAAFDHALSKAAAIRREPDCRSYRLAQVADYLCAIELAAVKYGRNEQAETDNEFFGTAGDFKRNCLKQARRKLPAPSCKAGGGPTAQARGFRGFGGDCAYNASERNRSAADRGGHAGSKERDSHRHRRDDTGQDLRHPRAAGHARLRAR